MIPQLKMVQTTSPPTPSLFYVENPAGGGGEEDRG